jgi:NAD(P)H-flavin reductase
MDHTAHRPGTREDCPECLTLAYEPGWYRSLRDDRLVGRRTRIPIPDVDERTFEVRAETTGLILPELESTLSPEDLGR